MRTILCGVLLCVCGRIGFSQITIQSADIDSQFGIGQTFREDSALIDKPITVGFPGNQNQTFDFSGVKYRIGGADVLVMAASATPLASRFSKADRAMRYVTDADTAYNYFSVNATSVSSFGFTRPGVTIAIDPPVPIFKLPLSMNVTSFFRSDSVPVGTARLTIEDHDTVDAWGVLVLPDWGGDCLRVKSWKRNTIVGAGPMINDSVYIEYTYIMTDGRMVTIRVDTADANASTLTPLSFTDRRPLGRTAVREIIPIRSQGFLWPMPAREHATLTVTMPSAGAIDVNVTTLLGASVATLHSRPLPAGASTLDINTSQFAAGTYFVHVSGAGVRTVDRLVIAK